MTDIYKLLHHLSRYGDLKIYTKNQIMYLECEGFHYDGAIYNYEEAIFYGILFLLAKIEAKEMVKNARIEVDSGWKPEDKK